MSTTTLQPKSFRGASRGQILRWFFDDDTGDPKRARDLRTGSVWNFSYEPTGRTLQTIVHEGDGMQRKERVERDGSGRLLAHSTFKDGEELKRTVEYFENSRRIKSYTDELDRTVDFDWGNSTAGPEVIRAGDRAPHRIDRIPVHSHPYGWPQSVAPYTEDKADDSHRTFYQYLSNEMRVRGPGGVGRDYRFLPDGRIDEFFGVPEGISEPTDSDFSRTKAEYYDVGVLKSLTTKLWDDRYIKFEFDRGPLISDLDLRSHSYCQGLGSFVGWTNVSGIPACTIVDISDWNTALGRRTSIGLRYEVNGDLKKTLSLGLGYDAYGASTRLVTRS